MLSRLLLLVALLLAAFGRAVAKLAAVQTVAVEVGVACANCGATSGLAAGVAEEAGLPLAPRP